MRMPPPPTHADCELFKTTFGIDLEEYWEGRILRLDVLALDRNVVKTRRYESMNAALLRQHGQGAVDLVQRLL